MKTLQLILIIFILIAALLAWQENKVALAICILFGLFAILRIKHWIKYEQTDNK